MCTTLAIKLSCEFLKHKFVSPTAARISACNALVEPAAVRTASGYTTTKSIRLPSPLCHVALDCAIDLGSGIEVQLLEQSEHLFPREVFSCQEKFSRSPL